MKASIALFEFSKYGKPEVIIEPTLIEYNEDGKYTEEMMKIYDMPEEVKVGEKDEEK